MTTSVRLRDIGRAYGGLTAKTKADFGQGNASFVTFVEVIGNARLRGNSLDRVRVAKAERQNRVMRGDLLFNGSSETPEEVALSAVVDFEPTASTYLNSFCFGFRVRSGATADPTYLAYFFRSSAGRSLVACLAQGATRYNIAKTKFLDIELDLPPMERQREIVGSLCDADDLTAALKRTIAKKRAVRQGIMQQLLTGKTRLPGFTERWRHVSVGELLEFKNGLNKGREFFGAGTPIVNFMDVMHGPLIRAETVTGRVTLTQDEIKRFSARRGDLFFTRTSESVKEIGTVAVLVDEIRNAVFSGFILRGRPISPDVDSLFLAYLFQTAEIRDAITSAATYTTRALTNGRTLSSIRAQIPPQHEQRRIVEALTDIENEIGILRDRLTKAHHVKQGMMQELLAGQTRGDA